MRKRASRGPRLWRAAARSCGQLEAVSSSTESSISGAPPPSRPPEGHGVVVAAYHGRLSRARLQGADLRWPSSKPRARRRRTTSPHSRKATWPTAPPNRSPGRTLALGRSENCGLLAALCHRATGAALRLVAAPRTFVRPSLPPAPLRATSTRQGFDTAIGMRPISSPDALMIEIQNPSRLPSYAISCARAAPRAAASSFVGNSIPSSSFGTSVANHVKSIPHVGPPIVVRPSRSWQLGQVACGFLVANKWRRGGRMSTDFVCPVRSKVLTGINIWVAICGTLNLLDALPKLSDVRATWEQRHGR